MHDVTGIIEDNFQVLVPFKFMCNYEVNSNLLSHAKIAVGRNRIYYESEEDFAYLHRLFFRIVV